MRQSREMELDPLSEVFLKSRSFSVKEIFPTSRGMERPGPKVSSRVWETPLKSPQV